MDWFQYDNGLRHERVKEFIALHETHPAGIYLLKVNNRNSRIRSEICSNLTMKTPE